ncbi:MAG: acetylxylan esterase [Clostridia bacterium]|nr:acetylxylan esterase [Clostridia bacterium]
MLAYREELVPQIGEMEELSAEDHDGYRIIQLRYRTWERCYAAATLYLPHGDEKLPLVFLCCGHGKQGRLSSGYIAMGHRLASLGLAVMVLDNLGQGDRNLQPNSFQNSDHWLAVAPFYCGLTLQGMIVMETVAMIRHMQKDPRFDADRFGVCGNSGGGTLSLFLAALAPEISVLSSSGYPSEFGYILAKERLHCACNLLRGAANGPDMWEIFSTFAPKPLLLEGGAKDDLIPLDLAHRNARKVHNTYQQLDAEGNFEFELTSTHHPWELEDINRISRFLSEQLLGKTPVDMEVLHNVENIESYRVPMPEDMLHTDELAQVITGIQMPEGTRLSDVFPAMRNGKPVDPQSLQLDVGRGDVMRVFAQFEISLEGCQYP